MSWTIKTFEKNDELVDQLSKKIEVSLHAAIKKQGFASMAVSGGSTPRSLFEKLSEIDLPWDKVSVTLVDERWVDEKNKDSNARFVKEHLLKNNAKQATFVGLTTLEDDVSVSNDDKEKKSNPFLVEKTVEQKLQHIKLPFTVVVLGMGNDGHTASFFPGASTLSKALYPTDNEWCVAVTPPSAPHDRMTLTLPTLLNCEHLILHIVGAEKWHILQKAIQPGAVMELPIRSVLYQYKKILEIFYATE